MTFPFQVPCPQDVWTPVVTFGTPGTSSIAYTVQSGTITKQGKRVTIEWALAFTPTIGTGSGALLVTGCPEAAASALGAYGSLIFNGITKATYTQFLSRIGAVAGQTIDFPACGSGVAIAAVQAADIVSGAAMVLRGSISFLTA